MGHKRVPSREGGIEIVVEELSSRMATLGNEITIYNRKRKNAEKLTEYKGCTLKEVFTIDKKIFDAIVYSYFATSQVKKGDYDVIHIHAEGPCAFMGKLKKCKAKKVVTIHGLDWQRGKWSGLGSKFLMWCEKQAVKYADEIIVLSKNNVEYFEKTYGRKTVFIPNGVNKPEIKSANQIKEKWGLEKDNYVLFLARLVPEKGAHYLIDAWKKLTPDQKQGKKLVIAGGNSHADAYYDELMETCNGVEDIITTGFIQGEILEEIYSNAYLYVLPSDIEGMPMSLLEALSYGNVCLTSDIPENTEVLQTDGYTFKKSDVQDLADKLCDLITQNLQTHTNQIIRYSWDDVVNQTIELYKKVNGDKNATTID